MEEKVKSELGEDGDVWRVMSSNSDRLSRIDDAIWKGNGDSITSQIIKLRTELRAIAVGISILIPILMKVIDLWLGSP